MRVGLMLALLLLVAPIAYANATAVERPIAAEVTQPLATADAPVAPSMNLDLIQAEQHSPANSDATVQDMPRRWSFWWVVGALVVAGVILAVVT